MPISRIGERRARRRAASWAIRMPTPPTATPSSTVTTSSRLARRARPGPAATGVTQRGSTTRTVYPAAATGAAALSTSPAIAPTATTQHVDVGVGAGSASTSTPPTRRTRRDVGAERGLREAQHGRAVAIADRLAQLRRAASASSRGAAMRRPGTMPSIARSHMPLWTAPSSPVMPARSSTKVTGSRCSATSISSWSKARLRKVA